MKITHKSKQLLVAALLVLGLSGVTFGVAHAATTGANNAPAASATEDNGKDGETNDDAKTSSAADNDTVQDGETNDDPSQ